jgi:hypothetical protein
MNIKRLLPIIIAAAEMFGYEKDELEDQPLSLLIPPNTEPHIHITLRDFLSILKKDKWVMEEIYTA